MFFKPLPWEYGIRNLFRRPMRTALTFAALTTVVVLILVVVGFIRGLERSLDISGDPDVAIILALGMGKNLEYSSIPMNSGDVVSASLRGIQERHGKKYVSPELYLGTEITIEPEATNDLPQSPGNTPTDENGNNPALGLVRGVTPSVLLVRRRVELEAGTWPKSGEIIVGRLAATKLGATSDQVAIGQTLTLEGRKWRISGVFSAGGAAFESEIWCRLDELQQAMKRQDLSLVAMTLAPGADFTELDMFLKSRSDLELHAMREDEYYDQLQDDYQPVLWLAWLVVLLVSGAGIFAGLNTMYGSVVGRIRELSSLQTIGFARRAVMISLVQEGLLLSAAASLFATLLAILLAGGIAVRFTMGAFSLNIDGVTTLIGCGVGMGLGVLGAIPPAIRALRMPIVDGLRSV